MNSDVFNSIISNERIKQIIKQSSTIKKRKPRKKEVKQQRSNNNRGTSLRQLGSLKSCYVDDESFFTTSFQRRLLSLCCFIHYEGKMLYNI